MGNKVKAISARIGGAIKNAGEALFGDKFKPISAGIGSAILTVGGAFLTCGSLGTASSVGIPMMGAGYSGLINSCQQYEKGDKFSFGSYFSDMGIGAASSLVTVGAGKASSYIAKNLALKGGKWIACQTGCRMAGNAIIQCESDIAQKTFI